MDPTSPTAKILSADVLVTVSGGNSSTADVPVSIVNKAAGRNFDVIGKFAEELDGAFRVPLPKELLDGASSNVAVRCSLWEGELAVTVASLDDKGEAIARKPTADRPVDGTIEYFDGQLLRGWAYNPRALNERLSVDIFVDNHRYASAVADERRAALLNRAKGDGRHGFSKVMPASLLDGRRHVVACRVGGGGPLVAPPIEVDVFALRQFIINETLKQIRRLERLLE